MRLKRFAVFHNGEKKRWLKLTGISETYPDGTGLTLVDKFERDCIMDEEQVDAFLNKGATDPRYEKRVINITISKV